MTFENQGGLVSSTSARVTLDAQVDLASTDCGIFQQDTGSSRATILRFFCQGLRNG